MFNKVSYIAMSARAQPAELSTAEAAMDYLDPERWGLVIKVTVGDNTVSEVIYETKGEYHV